MKMPVPKYFVVRSILEARLERDYSVGDKIPTELELCREFEVSRITIQQALSLLESDGLIKREQGRGTFYTRPPTRRQDAKPNQLLQSLLRNQPNGFARLISARMTTASARIAERLRVEKGSRVAAVDRVGFIDGDPVIFITAYMPGDVGAELLKDEAALTRSTLGSLVQSAAGIRISSVVQTIAATLADPGFAGHLGLELGAPVLEGERTYYDEDGRPVIFSDAFYRADRHRFVVDLNGAVPDPL
ncbi:phosphonate metabolism transcriptional regulator PhnF [Agaricicola taiwanensis]|uniref:Phosphonate metabolism transcriptional regulator PhnF n=1 Tax=Agaricicola taiwanensis TaxID=591372 RepID=A0A8J2VL97_9RHOB|nr:GntR family transcriptional regulator [Agaricicola taiwanensis]GGE31230.1 phosphonate metabolism transcriptional regulator PhnF [Agaricicola taiwanensis]